MQADKSRPGLQKRKAQLLLPLHRFEQALASFRAAAILRPDDGPCRVFVARCMDFLRDGPPEGWNGTWHFDIK